jgi:hypothetical protein
LLGKEMCVWSPPLPWCSCVIRMFGPRDGEGDRTCAYSERRKRYGELENHSTI